MATEKAWKRHERAVAKKLGTVRAFNKGIHSAEDVEHDLLAVECKYNKSVTALGWYEQAVKQCGKASVDRVNAISFSYSGPGPLCGTHVILTLDDFLSLVSGKVDGLRMLRDRKGVRAQHIEWMEQAMRHAAGTDKVPVVVAKQHKQNGELVYVLASDLRKLIARWPK